MKRTNAIVVFTVIVLAGSVMGLFPAFAQESGTPATKATPQPQRNQSMMEQCMQMMSSMGMSEKMMKRMDAMMKTPIFLDSPCAVYGQAVRLGLSDEQKQHLVQIENEARKQSLAVLTPEQLQTLGDLPKTPMPMIKMCETMKAKMGKKMGNGGPMGMMQMGGDGGPMGMMPGMCKKMMQKMQGDAEASGNDSKSEKSK